MPERSTFVDIRAPGGLLSGYCNLKIPARPFVESVVKTYG